MLNHKFFYHHLIKKYTIAFGAIFNQIFISRTDENGVEIDNFRVPLTFATKDKMLARIKQDPTIDQPAAIVLPLMSFSYSILGYDGDRKLNKIGKTVTTGTDASHMKTVFNPVPYDISFQLYIYVKNTEDGTKIIEQILPFFTPDYTVSLQLIPEMNIIRDVPIVLNSVVPEEKFEGEFLNRPFFIWTLDFTIKGYLYGPVVERPLIKFVNTQTFVGNTTSANTPVLTTNTYPGLDANGNPTTNAEIAIDPLLVNFDDPYSFIYTSTPLVEPALGEIPITYDPLTASPLIWLDPSDLSTLFQDAEMTIPVTKNGDPVGAILDKSGNGHHAFQSQASAKPAYRTSGGKHWIEFDGIDDFLATETFSAAPQPIERISAFRTISDALVFGGGRLLGPELQLQHDGIAVRMGIETEFPIGQALSGVDFVAFEHYQGASSFGSIDNNPTVDGSDASSNLNKLVIGTLAAGVTNTLTHARFYGIAVKNGTFTTEHLSQLRTYLAAKQGRIL